MLAGTAEKVIVDVAKLPNGVPLSVDLRNEAGEIVARTGELVTAALQKKLTGFNVFMAADQEKMDSPDKVISELKKFEERRPGGSKRDRIHDRHAWCVKLSIQLLEPTGTLKQEVTTCDLSKGGFAFISHRLIHVGTQLKTIFDMLPSKPRLGGVVRNCIYIQPRQYRVGIQFQDPNDLKE
ncbi:MAG: PilZ domain-containing protein [Phycisphaerae bacterium]